MSEGSSHAPPIGDQDQENVNQNNGVDSNTEKPVTLEVFDSAPRKWAKMLKRSHDMLVSPVDVNRPPHQLFEQFSDDDGVIEYLCQQANLYASFKEKVPFFVDKDEMRVFIAILLTKGYSAVPQSWIMCEQGEDVHNSAVSQLMNRGRFDEILRYLYLADNNNLAAGGKLAKVRPFYEMMNERFLKPFQLEENLCVDKAMIPYYRKYSAKQYIKGKPTKFC